MTSHVCLKKENNKIKFELKFHIGWNRVVSIDLFLSHFYTFSYTGGYYKNWSFLLVMSYSDKLAHVQVIINCQYSIAQMCTREDTLARYLGAPSLDFHHESQ